MLSTANKTIVDILFENKKTNKKNKKHFALQIKGYKEIKDFENLTSPTSFVRNLKWTDIS